MAGDPPARGGGRVSGPLGGLSDHVSTHGRQLEPCAQPPARRLRAVTLVRNLDLRGGGAERLARELATGLDPARFERWLCVIKRQRRLEREGDRLVRELERAGVRLVLLDQGSRYDFRAWARLLRFLASRRIDVLHCHALAANVLGVVLGRLARVKVIVAHEHTWSFQGRPLRRLLDREVIARGSDAFVAVSREDRRKMIEIEGIDPADVVFLPNGIPDPSPSRGTDVRAELGVTTERPTIGTVSVLRPQKAVEVLLEAVAILLADRPDLAAVIVGLGWDRERLEGIASRLGLDRAVTFAGQRGDIPDVLEALDVAVSSSDFEGSPLAIMEYMEAARPIVATAVGGVPDLIEDRVHGLLVPPRDPTALARAVARLLDDPALGRRLGQAAQARRRREFSLEVMVRRVESLYERLYAAKAAGAPEPPREALAA